MFVSKQILRGFKLGVGSAILAVSAIANAQSLLFDGGFESGTFQGWTSGGINGGFAAPAAKGTCFSGNDTTAISFNGDLGNQYAALLRSNADGDPASIGIIASDNFAAGRGILFSALSETSDPAASKKPVQLIVKVLSSDGKVLSELPVQTAVVQLAPGCPSIKRDTAFSVHYIDTSQHNGEISIEFSQSTRTKGFAYFTLIDNVVLVEKGQVFVSQSQPIARAGTSLTSSNILFLDPRDSIDPDGAPAPLTYSWFINGEDTIRLYDMPCVNVNSDFTLAAGNHTATLYASDGVNYSADTIRFVVTSEQTTVGDEDDEATTGDVTLTTPKGDPIVNESNVVSSEDVTLTDPKNECDIDVSDIIDDEDGNGGGTDPESLFLDIDSGSDETFNNVFTIGSDPVSLTSNNVEVSSSADESVTSITISINTPQGGDTLTAGTTTVNTLNVSNNGTASITILPDQTGNEVSDSDYEIILEAIVFEYTVGDGETVVTEQRTITYSTTDSAGDSFPTSSTITIEE